MRTKPSLTTRTTTASMARTKLIGRAQAAIDRNDITDAERICRILLERDAKDIEALGLSGIIAVKTRNLDEAIRILPKAIRAHPRHASMRLHFGAALMLLGRSEEALRQLDRSVALAPDDPLALNVRACVLGNLNRYEESLRCCDLALALRPDYVAALINRGNAYAELGRHEDALESFEDALWQDPKSLDAINNCANTLKRMGKHAQAVERYDQALKVQPRFTEAAFNRGVALAETGRIRAAIKSYLHALSIEPRHLLARYNLSLCRLLLGDFPGAWTHHEAWIERAARDGKQREFTQPRWRGDAPLAGRTILLHADEGLGDTIQFSRYAREAAARGAQVILEVQRPLMKVLRDIEPTCRVVARGAKLPRFDLHCPLMHLPAAFRTRLDSIPSYHSYVRADERLQARWEKRLASSNRLRIGIVWSGNRAHANDANRSLPLHELLPLLRLDVDWISLQKEVRPSDAPLLARQKRLRHFGEDIRDFSDTAAIIAHLDLVIAVDTSVAHLAGAMGKPVWILLPLLPDWRWMLKRSDSPWYPSARLFRQRRMGDWTGVVRSVRRALAATYAC